MRNNSSALFSLITAMILVMILMALGLPLILRQRSAARSTACGMRLIQIGLATHNYHAAFRQLPPALGGTTGGKMSNQGRLGPLVALLPFVEQQKLWESIINPLVNSKTETTFPSMGPEPWHDPSDYTPWNSAPSAYRCPESSTSVIEAEPHEPRIVTTLAIPDSILSESSVGTAANYVYSAGDSLARAGMMVESNDDQQFARAAMRGVFMANKKTRFSDVLDGLSNTLMFSETVSAADRDNTNSKIANNVAGLSKIPALCLKAHAKGVTQWWDTGRGQRWNEGTLAISGFQTVLRPNSPSCLSEKGAEEPLVSASSLHVDGVHVVFADGAVKYISNEIECGDSAAAAVSSEPGMSPPGSVSPYGLWGALGSRAAKEVIRVEIGQSIEREPTDGLSTGPALTVWTDRDGEIELKAKLIRIIDRKTVELEDSSGILHRVPLNTLSDQDIYRSVMLSLQAEE